VTVRYRVVWPMIGPFAFRQGGRGIPLRPLYAGDEFDDLGTPEELDRMVAEGMIEPIGVPVSASVEG
jgi:hypothetical protein